MSEEAVQRTIRPWFYGFWIVVALALVVVFNIWPDAAHWAWGKPAALAVGLLVGAVMLWFLRARSKS